MIDDPTTTAPTAPTAHGAESQPSQPPHATPAPGGHPVPGTTLTIGLAAAVTASAFEVVAVATAMPVAGRALGHLSWYAWAFTAFQIGMLVAIVASGRASDRIGPVRPMLTGIGVFAVGLVISGTATTMAQLITGRFVQGLGAGALTVPLYVIVARAYPSDRRARVFSWMSTAWVVPAFVGPPISAWLTQHLSWHWVFLAVLPILAVATAMVWPGLRAMRRAGLDGGTSTDDGDDGDDGDTTAATVPPAPIWAAIVVGVGVPLIQFAGQHLQWWALAPLVAGLAAVLIGTRPLMPAGFIRFRGVLSTVIGVRMLIAGAFFAGESFVPLMLVERRGVPLVWAGAILTIGAIGWTTGSFTQSSARFAAIRDRALALGSVSLTIGVACVFAVSLVSAIPAWIVAVGWVFAGLGMGLSYNATSVSTIAASAPAEQGRNSSSLQLAEALGNSCFTAAAGTVFAALHAASPGAAFSWVFTLSTVVAATSIVMGARAVLALRSARRRGIIVG